MIAAQPKQAEFDQKTPILAVGVDNGHGLLKVALDADSRQMKPTFRRLLVESEGFFEREPNCNLLKSSC
jgi:hypothetical protein